MDTGPARLLRSWARKRPMRIYALSLCVALLLASCEGRALSWTRPFALDMTPPPGPPNFQQGWRDGCDAGVSGFGNQFNKLHYDARYDTALFNDLVYNRMWNAAARYCALFSSMADMQDSDPYFQHEPW